MTKIKLSILSWFNGYLCIRHLVRGECDSSN